MPQLWANSGSGLFLEIDREHVRSSLENALRDAVRTGRLGSGTKLPPSRTLAHELGVARNTVVNVYAQLVAEGWLSARVGASTVVGHRTVAPPVHPPRTVANYPIPAAFDLRAGWPDLSDFPRTAWLDAARRAIIQAPNNAFGYQEPRGRIELRRALADYLSRVRGVHATAEQVVICLGTMHALQVIGLALRQAGATTWATESHGLSVHREAAATLGFSLRYVPVDEQGAQVQAFGDADAALIAPAHQFPFGHAMSAQRRREAVRWSRETGGILIEDDYDGEFRYDRRPVGALQGLAPDRVIYVVTTSKSLAPGLRLGWMVLPPEMLDPVLAVKTLSQGHNSTLDQLTLAELISTGDYDRHLRHSRLRYRRRRDELLRALHQFSGIKITGVAAGLHALVWLPRGISEQEVIGQAARVGLTLEGLRHYTPAGQHSDEALVIGYGSPPEHAYRECFRLLVTALRAARVR